MMIEATDQVDARPDAVDLEAASLYPSADLIASNAHLDDPAMLADIYEAQGYLLLRNVLDHGSISRALRRMMDIMARHGIVVENATEPKWTGSPLVGKHEESPEFAGICRELIEHPHNLAIMEKILGEPAIMVPNVSYRSYPPNTPLSMVHQDGQYSPGIDGFRPVWIPLMDIDENVGGLILAPGQHKRGRLHNLAKPPVFPIAADTIPANAWATTTYHAGDVLVVHPWTPHVGMANRSDRVRFSIDTRVQSAANPSVVLGDVVAVDASSITLCSRDGVHMQYAVDEDSYLRTGSNPGARLSLQEFARQTSVGMRVLASTKGGTAVMVRRASEP